MMKAVTLYQAGLTENLKLENVAIPEPREGQILARIKTLIRDWSWGARLRTIAFKRFLGP